MVRMGKHFLHWCKKKKIPAAEFEGLLPNAPVLLMDFHWCNRTSISSPLSCRPLCSSKCFPEIWGAPEQLLGCVGRGNSAGAVLDTTQQLSFPSVNRTVYIHRVGLSHLPLPSVACAHLKICVWRTLGDSVGHGLQMLGGGLVAISHFLTWKEE